MQEVVTIASAADLDGATSADRPARTAASRAPRVLRRDRQRE